MSRLRSFPAILASVCLCLWVAGAAVIDAQDRDIDIAPLIISLDTLSGIEKIEALNSISEKLIEQDRPTEAVPFAEDALKLADSAGSAWEALRARVNLGTALFFSGGDNFRTVAVLKKATEDLESLEKDPGNIPRDRILRGRLRAADYLGRILMEEQDNTSALTALTTASETAREIGNDQALSDILHRTAVCHLYLTQYSEALASGIEALEISRRIGHERLTAANEYIIGYIHRDLGNLDLSLSYFQSSLENARKAKDDYRSALALNEIGNILGMKSEFDKALEFKKEALKLAESIGEAYLISCCLHDIGNLYLQMKDFRQALPYLLRAFDIDIDSGNARDVAIVSQNIALIYSGWNQDAAGSSLSRTRPKTP
jgi:tetratricopeptide (TPR) repeat protein